MGIGHWIKEEIDAEFSRGIKGRGDEKKRRADGGQLSVSKKVMEMLPIEVRTSIKIDAYICLYYRIGIDLFSKAVDISLDDNKKRKIIFAYKKTAGQEIVKYIYTICMPNEASRSYGIDGEPISAWNNTVDTTFIVLIQEPSFDDTAVLISSKDDMRWTSFISMIREYARK